jgi:hypothetical protein
MAIASYLIGRRPRTPVGSSDQCITNIGPVPAVGPRRRWPRPSRAPRAPRRSQSLRSASSVCRLRDEFYLLCIFAAARLTSASLTWPVALLMLAKGVFGLNPGIGVGRFLFSVSPRFWRISPSLSRLRLSSPGCFIPASSQVVTLLHTDPRAAVRSLRTGRRS